MSSPPAPLLNNAMSHDDVDGVCLASKTSTMLAVKSYMLWGNLRRQNPQNLESKSVVSDSTCSGLGRQF